MRKQTRKSMIAIVVMMIIALMTESLPAIAAQKNTASAYKAVVTEATAVYADAACTEQAGSLNEYDIVTVTGIQESIARVRYGGYTLYMDASAVTDVKEMVIPAKVTTTTFVFEDASITARSLSLKEGTIVNVIATNGQWAMIEYKGSIGYAYKGYLEAVDSTGDTTESTDAAIDDDEEDPFLAQDTEIVGPNLNKDAAKVTVQTIKAVVSVTTLPVYKAASTKSAKLGKLAKGREVTVYAYNSNWAYIAVEGKYGFCALKGLKKTEDAPETPEETQPEDSDVDASKISKATVTVDTLAVYTTASTSSKKLGTLKRGLEVNVIKTSSKWAYIELDGKYGFCLIAGLTPSENVETPSETKPSDVVVDGTAAIGTCTVITATAPLYEKASTSSSYKTVTMGTTYDFYKYNKTWVMVGVNGEPAYIPLQYLSAENYAEMKKEDSGSSVKTMNEALLKLGYLDDEVTTNFSSETVLAVQRFQTACGMKVTGTADLATLRVLYGGKAPQSPILSASLSNGSTGENVTRIQTRLYSLGYLSKSSSIDGSYGTTTANAIKLFQTAAGGSATGKADSNTIKALYHPEAPTMPSNVDAADATTTVAPSGGSTATTTQISSSLASTTSTYSSSMTNAQKLEYVIWNAQQQLGKRYVYGSAGTATFDCSGLTMYAFGKIGVSLPHSAYSQGYNDKYTKLSSASSMRRGDLIFFNTVSDSDQCDHVGIYLGNYYFIHASSGAGKVVVSNVSSGYYNRVFSWGRRILA